MSDKNKIVVNYNWDNYPKDNFWIKNGDSKYQYLNNNLISKYFPALQEKDKTLLLDALCLVINLIHLKFGFGKGNKTDIVLWNQLTQNKLLDLRALLALLLPYIDDNETDDKKKSLRNLEEIYTAKNNKGQYIYTNTQYNRCVRYEVDKETTIYERPYINAYFNHHLELLLMSIELVANKLFINWVDVIPVKMTDYTATDLYKATMKKFNSAPSNVTMINNYVDPEYGISYQDFYNTMSNHLFHEIKNKKWLIYDIKIQDTIYSYLSYIESKINLDAFWSGKLWSQLDKTEIGLFTNQWYTFLNSTNINDNTVLHHFYFFFSKYHKNSQILINQKKLILSGVDADDDDDEENIIITPEITTNAKLGLRNVPIDEIYLFFNDQLSVFKHTWFYYMIRTQKKNYLSKIDVLGTTVYVTPKNIYNYCKSLTHLTLNNKYVEIPKLWYSLVPELIEVVLIRMLDIPKSNDWKKINWFNINKYIRRMYPDFKKIEDLLAVNYAIHLEIKKNIVDIVFQSLICHGILSDFNPSPEITNNSVVESSIGTTDDRKKLSTKGLK